MAKIVGKENADGTTTVKVAKGAKVVTKNGKVATGGKIVDTLPSKTKTKAAAKKSKDIISEIDDLWEDDVVDFENPNLDILDEEPASNVFLYVSRDGILGNVKDDNFQIIDTSGISEEEIYEIANADPENRAQLAEDLRAKGGIIFASKHWFNDTGDYGSLRDVRIVDGGDLTKSEMRDLMDAEDPFEEAKNYDSGSFNLKSALVSVKKGNRSNSTDDFLDDEMINEGTSYIIR